MSIQMEDKKCRICGLADMSNLNIFQSNSKLSEKIVAVFPIVLYPNDPFPKHICKKCAINTNNMYYEIEKAVRNQGKWLANVRSVQPDNHYVKVVDSIEGANRQTSQLVSLIAGGELGERTVCHMFNLKTDLVDNPKTLPSSCSPPQVESKPFEEEDGIENKEELPASNCLNEIKKVPTQKQTVQIESSNPKTTTKITQLKSVLELNGCTLTKVKTTTKSDSKKDDSVKEVKVEIKKEPCEEYSETIPQSDQLLQNTDLSPNLQPLQLSEPFQPVEFKEVRCKLCPFSCETIEELAIHQLNHLSIAVTKLSERRFLDKRIRRGRLIRVEEKKCIRCLNCWRIFADNKSILHHWSEGDCDYFCQICGKEFSTSPKMLREHIPAAHGISYRSTKALRPPSLIPRKPIKNEKSPLKSEFIMKSEISPSKSNKTVKIKSPKTPLKDSLSVKVACNICLKVFANFKARNSHMRAHKHPPFIPAPSLSETLLALNRNDMMKIKEEPLDFESIPYQNVNPRNAPVPSTSSTAPTQNTAPAGIRMKNVKMRTTPKTVLPKNEPGLIPISPLLQVKSLVDLQDPSVSSQLPENADKSRMRAIGPASVMAARKALTLPPPVLVNSTPSVNGQTTNTGAMPKDNMNYGQIFNCHPCGGKFTSKLELFRHKRKCTANNLFPCQFCERHFLTSADLQMHIMLLHKSSCA